MDDLEHLTPEHLSLLAAILYRSGTNPRQAVDRAVDRAFDIFRSAYVKICWERCESARHRAEYIEKVVNPLLPREDCIPVAEAFDEYRQRPRLRYKIRPNFVLALKKYGAMAWRPNSDGTCDEITSMRAVEAMLERVKAEDQKRDRERKKKSRSSKDLRKSSADKIAAKPDKEEEIRKLKGQKRKLSTKIRNTIPPP